MHIEQRDLRPPAATSEEDSECEVFPRKPQLQVRPADEGPADQQGTHSTTPPRSNGDLPKPKGAGRNNTQRLSPLREVFRRSIPGRDIDRRKRNSRAIRSIPRISPMYRVLSHSVHTNSP